MDKVVKDLSIELLKSPLIFIPVAIGMIYIIYRIIKFFINIKKTAQDFINESTATDLTNSEKQCPKCSGKLVLREGQYGKFYGCSNYPKCRYTEKLKNE